MKVCIDDNPLAGPGIIDKAFIQVEVFSQDTLPTFLGVQLFAVMIMILKTKC